MTVFFFFVSMHLMYSCLYGQTQACRVVESVTVGGDDSKDHKSFVLTSGV